MGEDRLDHVLPERHGRCLHGPSLLPGSGATRGGCRTTGPLDLAGRIPGDDANVGVAGPGPETRTVPAFVHLASQRPTVDDEREHRGLAHGEARRFPGRTRTRGAAVSDTNGTPNEMTPSSFVDLDDGAVLPVAKRPCCAHSRPTRSRCVPDTEAPVSGVATHRPSRSMRTRTSAGDVSVKLSVEACPCGRPRWARTRAGVSATRPSVRLTRSGTTRCTVAPVRRPRGDQHAVLAVDERRAVDRHRVVTGLRPHAVDDGRATPPSGIGHLDGDVGRPPWGGT